MSSRKEIFASTPLRPTENRSDDSSADLLRSFILPRTTSTPLKPPIRDTPKVSPTRSFTMPPRRYSLSEEAPSLYRSQSSPLSRSHNLNTSTLLDTRSPGYAGRLVRYSEEREKEKDKAKPPRPIYQAKYGGVGVFPIVHFFKKDLPVLKKKPPAKVTVRVGTANLTRFNTPEHNRLLLERIVQPDGDSSTRLATPPRSTLQEASTRSVLDALKEISRKRIHSDDGQEEEEDDDGKRMRIDCQNDVENRKRRRNPDSPQPEFEPTRSPTSGLHSKKKVCSINEVMASHSSTAVDADDLQDSAETRRSRNPKRELKRDADSPKAKRVVLVNVETQTATTPAAPETPPPDKETLLMARTPITSAPTAQPHPGGLETVEAAATAASQAPPAEHPKRESPPIKIFDERPLEMIRKKRLNILMGFLDAPGVRQSSVKDYEEKLRSADDADGVDDDDVAFSTSTSTPPGGDGKPLVSILSGSRRSSPHKKHVSFSLPPEGSAPDLTTPGGGSDGNVANASLPFTIATTSVSSPTLMPTVSQTSTSLVTPIVSSTINESQVAASVIAKATEQSALTSSGLAGAAQFGNGGGFTTKDDSSPFSFDKKEEAKPAPPIQKSPAIQFQFGSPTASATAPSAAAPTSTSAQPTFAFTPATTTATNATTPQKTPTAAAAPTTTQVPIMFNFGSPVSPTTTSITFGVPSSQAPAITVTTAAPVTRRQSPKTKYDAAAAAVAAKELRKMGGFKFDLANPMGVQNNVNQFGYGVGGSSGITDAAASAAAAAFTAVKPAGAFSFGSPAASNTGAAFGVVSPSSAAAAAATGAPSTANVPSFFGAGTLVTTTAPGSGSSAGFGADTANKPGAFTFGGGSGVVATTVAPAAGAPFAFGATNTIAPALSAGNAAPAFGTGGTTATTTVAAPFAFGSSSGAAFGTASSAAGGLAFGSTAAAPVVFGSGAAATVTTTTAAPAPPTFGSGFGTATTVTTTTTAALSMSGFGTGFAFGGPAIKSGFGVGSGTPAFGAPAAASTTATNIPAFGSTNMIFGGSAASNSSFGSTTPAANTSFGGTSAAAKPLFGSGATTTAPPAFGAVFTTTATSSAPAFGSSTTVSSSFGNASNTTLNFGTAATAPATPSFGSTGSASGALNFGSTSTTGGSAPSFGGSFGSTAAAAAPASNTFGSSGSTGAFGGSAGNTGAFGASSSFSSGFGSANTSFGAASGSTTAVPNGFGSAAGSSSTGNTAPFKFGGFGSNTASNTPAAAAAPASSTFGTASAGTAFGATTTTTPSFGNTAFGSNPAAGAASSVFGAPTPAPTGNTVFGGGSSSSAVNNPNVAGQSGIFAFGSSGAGESKPATGVFSFGSAAGEAPKPTFNFTAGTAPNFAAPNFGASTNGMAFGSPAPPFSNPPTPGMFSIGAGSSTPNRSRPTLKGKRRT